jgi:hypothetical protein
MMAGNGSNGPATRNPMMASIFRAILLALLVSAAAPWVLADEVPEKTVQLTIDYGDGVQKVFTSLPWKEKLTVFDALDAAAKHPRGIKVVHQGSGERLFITAIDDLKNEGRGLNWTYQVDGKLADRSAGVFELSAGDAVLWRFAQPR